MTQISIDDRGREIPTFGNPGASSGNRRPVAKKPFMHRMAKLPLVLFILLCLSCPPTWYAMWVQDTQLRMSQVNETRLSVALGKLASAHKENPRTQEILNQHGLILTMEGRIETKVSKEK